MKIVKKKRTSERSLSTTVWVDALCGNLRPISVSILLAACLVVMTILALYFVPAFARFKRSFEAKSVKDNALVAEGSPDDPANSSQIRVNGN